MLQNFTLTILLSALVLFADPNVIHDRSGSDIDLIGGTRVTNMPYGYYISEFSQSSIKAFEDVDLSQYPDKKLLVGYGTFDINEENCRYLDVPSNENMINEFENIADLGNKTYGVSRMRMTYSQCKALTAQYSGYVYSPSDIASYGAVLNIVNNTRKGGTAKDLWVGYSRADCSSGYINDEGLNQSYTNFRFPNEICTNATLNTYSIAGSKSWERTSSTDTHYCPIEINSPDYKRPIKFCAPWLRVEREWKLQNAEELSRINGRDYDFRYMKYIMDYPEEVTICTELNTNAQNINIERFEFSCNAYDSIKASPACMEQITLPQCHINECAGYAEKTCLKVRSFTPFKDYDKGWIIQDGIETEAKVKDNKVTSVYDCPPLNPPASDCKTKETVIVIPTECPGSMCTDLASCLKDKTTTADYCLETYPCEKTYGSSSAIVYDGTTAIGLEGVCSDRGAVDENGNPISLNVTAMIERKSALTKTCVEYKEIEETNTSIKNCISESTGFKKTISGSITQEDIYKDDPNCIRINNLAEARPDVSSLISYTTKGFFKTSIQQAYIDGSTANTETNSSDYLLFSSAACLEPMTIEMGVIQPTEDETMQNFCLSTFSTAWHESRLGVFDTEGVKGFVYNKTGISSRIITAIASSSQASSIKDDFGNTKSVSNWGVSVFDSDYKITNHQNYQIAASASNAVAMANFLNGLPNGTLVAIVSHGDAKTNVYDNSGLKTALSNYGANTTYLGSLTTSSAYLLIGKKGEGVLKEQTSSTASTIISGVHTVSVSVPKVLEINELASCAANAQTLQMTQFNPSPKDYIFANAGISDGDVTGQNYCFLGGSEIQGDANILSISGDANGGVVKSTTTDSSLCNKYATCLSGNVSSVCSIDITTGGEPYNGAEPTIPETPPETPTQLLTAESGSFIASFNGYEDIFSIQEYTEGDFGYFSNYLFKLPKLNTVLFDGKEVSPIVQMTPIEYPEKYDFYVAQTKQTTKNQNPDGLEPKFSMLEKLTTQVGSTVSTKLGITGFLYESLFYTTVAGGIFPIMVFMPERTWGSYQSDYKIYQNITSETKYVSNVYGYESRDTTVPTQFVWAKVELQTGTLERPEFMQAMVSAVAAKRMDFEEMGFSNSMISNRMTSHVEGAYSGWPKIKWYKASAKKTSFQVDGDTGRDISKPINTVYMGATNSLSIVVPYIGDYELVAYDKNNNILSTVIVQEQNFAKNVESSDGRVSQAFAKVQFATTDNFNLAEGQTRTFSNGGCLASDYVEWGGGVSGAYYEVAVPDLGSGNDNCTKSNDIYVREHAATKVTVRSLDSAAPFVIKLKKPMPFANKVMLVNLLQEEDRKYECWDEIEPCEIGGASDEN